MPKTTAAAVEEVAPTSRRLVAMPLAELISAARNPKAHDLPGIARSISKFGYVDVISVDERTGRLVSGHGRVESLAMSKQQGHDAPDGVDVRADGEWLVPTLRGWRSRSDAEAEAFLVAANKLTEKGGWDERLLAELLTDVADAQLLELTGFDNNELDDLRAALDWDGDGGGSGMRNTNSLGTDADRYADRDTRTVILSYSVEQFEVLVEQLAELATRFDVDTNSDVVARLVLDAIAATAPTAEDDPAAEDEDEGE